MGCVSALLLRCSGDVAFGDMGFLLSGGRHDVVFSRLRQGQMECSADSRVLRGEGRRSGQKGEKG
jgi:hypothetical protein